MALATVTYVIVLLSVSVIESARILGVAPTPSYSHQVAFRPIWNALTKRGHDVTVITTDPQNDPSLNIKEIDVSFTYEIFKKLNPIEHVSKNLYNPFKFFSAIKDIFLTVYEPELLHPEVQAMLNNDTEHFDLVIVQYLLPLMFGFSERFKCPSIAISSLDLSNSVHADYGNPGHPIGYPDLILPYEGVLDFKQRLVSTGLFLFQLLPNFGGNDRQQTLLEKHFNNGKPMPPAEEIVKNVSLIFLNVDPAWYTRPLGPAFVPIGGETHLQAAKPLPKDLKKFLDGAKNGAIYFSLGTNVKSSLVPGALRKIWLDTFKDLPYQVLWKFDIVDLPGVSENVKIVNWLSQQDVLRHPNVKAFVTQGGMQSMEEAIFSNVPVVGIPFISDQRANVQKMVKRGMALLQDKDEMTKESFTEAIMEVVNNPRYKQNAMKIAELSRDRPMTGLENAIWWTEYVLRHKGAPNLRNPIMDLPSYQYYLLDTLGTILAVFLVLLFIFARIILALKKLFVRVCSTKFGAKVKKQ